MPLPKRMKPTKVSSKKMKELASQAELILSKIGSGEIQKIQN
jgi:hypothetical protein